MDAVHACLTRFLRDHAISRERRILVAASGGADSLALLFGLVAIGQPVSVAHVHHGLRGAEADEDEQSVRVHAGRLGVEYVRERVAADERDGRSPEARARELRYAALERLRTSARCAFVATGHTLDDQAETVLLRALRGTAPHGLAAIAPEQPERRLIRPLLGARRALLRGYLKERGLVWREDASNRDQNVPRNRLRSQVLPLLEAVQPGATEHLAALADAARLERGRVEPALERVLGEALQSDRGGLRIDPEPLLRLPQGRLRLALRALLERAGLRERVTRVHLLRIERFMHGARTGAELSLPGARVLRCERERFWLGARAARGPGAEPLARRGPSELRFRPPGRLVSIDPEDPS